MKYKEYLISNKLLNIYTKWLSLCNIAHNDKTFELFYKDFIIWYIFNKCIPEQFPKGFLDNINNVKFEIDIGYSYLIIRAIYNEDSWEYLFIHKFKNGVISIIDIPKDIQFKWTNFNIYLDDLSRNRIK